MYDHRTLESPFVSVLAGFFLLKLGGPRLSVNTCDSPDDPTQNSYCYDQPPEFVIGRADA